MPPLINFSEIDSEQFEVLSRELLVSLGAQNVVWTGRGADHGRDLAFVEVCQGIISRYERKWLVQCKHTARSGKSVSPEDIGAAIENRCREHQASAYLLICSVAPSSGLRHMIDGINANPDAHITVEVWDGGILERYLCEERNRTLLTRFFPQATARLAGEEPASGLLRRLMAKGFTPEHIARIVELDEFDPRLELAEKLASAEAKTAEFRIVREMLVDFVLMGSSANRGIYERLDDLPYEECVDFFSRTADIDENGSAALIRGYCQHSYDAGRKVNCIQFLIDRLDYRFAEVYPLLDGLDSEDIGLVLTQFGFDGLVQEAFERWIINKGTPDDFLNELSSHTSIDEAMVDSVSCSFSSGELTVQGKFSLSLDLQWGSGRDLDDGYGMTGSSGAEGAFSAAMDEEGHFEFTITNLSSDDRGDDQEDDE